MFACNQLDLSLTFTNFTTLDLGQYKSMITESNTTMGEDDINLLDAGKTIVNKGEWLWSPENIKRCQDLCWKVHDRAQSFVLRSCIMH